MRTSRTKTVAAALACLALAAAAQAEKPTRELAEGDADAGKELALTAEVGQPAPDFTLTDLAGEEHTLSDYAGKTVVLEWFNPDCPFVRKHHEKNKTMATTYSEFAGDDLVWLAINSGAPGKQGHGLERNEKAVADYGIAYPMLLDEDGLVGRTYGAKTTPHMYVIDPGGVLRYRGAIDDDRSPSKLGETNYVVKCLSALAAGEEMEPAETKSYGCSVKYGAAKPTL